MGDDSKSGQDKDIDFRVAEESEQVLVQDGVSSSCGVKKSSV